MPGVLNGLAERNLLTLYQLVCLGIVYGSGL